MSEITEMRIDTSAHENRIIASIHGVSKGPTLIFIAGIHGNEPAGIFAMQDVVRDLQFKKHNFKGSLYAIRGNLPALEKGIRYNKHDLNRLWTQEYIDKINQDNNQDVSIEFRQLKDIYNQLQLILATEPGPFYFFDLHTTSSNSIPFITVNDSLLNRKYTSKYPLPIVLGIEEYLEGALLSYINALGYIAFGFEGGQHDAPSSIEAHTAFIYVSIVFCGSLEMSDVDFDKSYTYLYNRTQNFHSFYEIYKRYHIKPFENFEMEPGFYNFQPVQRGLPLAKSNGKPITASQKGNIFMPLYQGKGNDGFFMIRKVPRVFLKLSALLRKIRFDKVLPMLPGVKWASNNKDELIVDLTIAKYFTKNFFHLLGYRSRTEDTTHLRVKNREAASRDSEYNF